VAGFPWHKMLLIQRQAALEGFRGSVCAAHSRRGENDHGQSVNQSLTQSPSVSK